MKKIIPAGLAAGVVMLIVGLVVSQVFSLAFPALKAEYINTNMFRPWSDPLMWLIFVEPFLLGLMLSFIWAKVKHVFKEKEPWQKGLMFGLAYGALSISGMIMSYSSFTISLLMVVSWGMSGIIQSVAAGLVFAKMNK